MAMTERHPAQPHNPQLRMNSDTLQGYAAIAIGLTLLTVVLLIITLSIIHWA